MYVLAINGSPHMDTGNTAMILNPFLEGVKEAGGDVDLFYTRKLKIEPCSGDLNCWFLHPGECGMKDDMEIILPRISKADILIWATPVYYAGITGPLKNLMDRQLPLHMISEVEGGQRKKVILVSTCSAWETDIFEPLLSQMNVIYRRADGSSDFAGALLRPHAEVMKQLIVAGERNKVKGIFDASIEAGRQLVKDGRISDEILKNISKELISQEVYYKATTEQLKLMQESPIKLP